MSDQDQLNSIKEKLLEKGSTADDPDAILKVVQAVREIRELQEVKREHSWSTFVSAITPLLAVLITAVTLVVQSWQSNHKAEIERDQAVKKAMFEEEQADYSEWRDVLKNVSLSEPSSVQMALFSLQGFLDPPSKHSSEARAIAVSLLPLTSNEDGFDVIFARLQKQTSKSNEGDLVAIGQKVAYLESDAMLKTINEINNPAKGCAKNFPKLFFQVEDCFSSNTDVTTAALNRVWLYSWEIDSVSSGLRKLWRKPGGHFQPNDVENLSGIILENQDFSGLNFSGVDLTGATIHYSDLSKANFDVANVRGTTFNAIRGVLDSTWVGTRWWEAGSLPCNLEEYLNSKYPPEDKEARRITSDLTAVCKTEDEKESKKARQNTDARQAKMRVGATQASNIQ